MKTEKVKCDHCANAWRVVADEETGSTRLQPLPEAGCSQGGCIHTKPSWDDDPVLGPLIREAYYDPANNPEELKENERKQMSVVNTCTGNDVQALKDGLDRCGIALA